MFTVLVEAGNADGTIWQAVAPATNADGFDSAVEVLDWTIANQTVATGDRWRVRVWEGADADTGTEPIVEHHHNQHGWT